MKTPNQEEYERKEAEERERFEQMKILSEKERLIRQEEERIAQEKAQLGQFIAEKERILNLKIRN